jgi:hypothetical protein
MRSLLRRLALTSFIAFLVCLSTSVAIGQGIVTGSVGGTVQDASSAVVPGATVTAVQTTTNVAFHTVTDNAGSFQIPGLPPGTYNVTITASGFSPTTVQNVNVSAGTQTPLGAQTLKIGASEAVIVQARLRCSSRSRCKSARSSIHRRRQICLSETALT